MSHPGGHGLDLNPANTHCVIDRISVDSNDDYQLSVYSDENLVGRAGILIRNAGSDDMRISSGTGSYMTLPPGDSLSLPVGDQITLTATCASGESTTAEVVEYV